GCADAQLLLSPHKSPKVFRNAGADYASNERRALIHTREKFATRESFRSRHHAASVRSPDFHSAQTAAADHFLPGARLFATRYARPVVRASAAAHHNVARPGFELAP